MPSARFRYAFNKERSLSAYYRGRSNQPGFTQLQPITDNSNLQNTVIGNPNLKPELENRLELKYKQSDKGAGLTIFSKLSLNQTSNKIVTSRCF